MGEEAGQQDSSQTKMSPSSLQRHNTHLAHWEQGKARITVHFWTIWKYEPLGLQETTKLMTSLRLLRP